MRCARKRSCQRPKVGYGFRSAKIKVGSGINADCDRIAAVRAAVCSEMALRIDANESYDASTWIRLDLVAGMSGLSWKVANHT